MPSSEHLASFSDDDVLRCSILITSKAIHWKICIADFQSDKKLFKVFLGGWHRKECYKSFKVVEKILQDEE